MADAFDQCQEMDRAGDKDRFLATLFAPEKYRRALHALYAFNLEIARVREVAHQPVAGEIRLQWWRDRIAELYRGVAVEHPVVEGLGGVISARKLPRDLFDALIGAREQDLEEAPFATMDELEAYADATSGNVMRLAARIPMGRHGRPEDVADAVHFFATGPEYITGQILHVDGGASAV